MHKIWNIFAILNARTTFICLLHSTWNWPFLCQWRVVYNFNVVCCFTHYPTMTTEWQSLNWTPCIICNFDAYYQGFRDWNIYTWQLLMFLSYWLYIYRNIKMVELHYNINCISHRDMVSMLPVIQQFFVIGIYIASCLS